MSLPAVLILVSDGSVVKHAPYPREDMQPVVGLDPAYEWLLKYTPFAAPVYDGRYYSLVTTDEVTTEPHLTYTWLNVYKRTYSVLKHDNTEIQEYAKNAESSANLTLISLADQVKYVTLALTSVLREIDGQTVTPEEEVVRTKFKNYGVKVWQNDTNFQAKIAEILLGNEPDLDDGWQTTE